METMVGKKLGRYFLTRYLARGGMSEIYQAFDERDKQMYALKLVWQINEEHSLCLEREIQMLMHFRHPNVLPILDYGVHEEIYYSVMPYIAHGTLKDRIIHGRLSAETAETILVQIANALQSLHDAGFVHRDVKPANILQDEAAHVWLADFGLVMEIDEEEDLSETDCLIGTPSYMAPELADTPASPSSDTYALGILLYEMLTGRVPFDGKTPEAIYRKQMYEQPPLPSKWNHTLSPALERVLLRALEKDPRDRYPSTRALAEAYHQALLSQASAPYQLLNPGKSACASQPVRRQQRQQQREIRRGGRALAALAAMARLTCGLVRLGGANHSGVPFLGSLRE